MHYSCKLVISLCFICIANGHDDFRFPQSSQDSRFTPNQTGTLFHHHHHEPKKIPLDLIRRLNSIENVTELHKFIDPTSFNTAEESEFLIGNRFGEDDNEVVMARAAGCKAEMTSVPLKESTDPSRFHYPACVRVPRCDGCCSSELVSCQAVQQETIYYQVIVTQFEGGVNLVYKGKEVVPVEHHIKCKCECIVKEKDCNELQEYQSGDCRCVCLNMDDQKNCVINNDTKLWDPRTCICSCRETKECSTGYYYDQSSCSCTAIPEQDNKRRRREAPQDSMLPLQDAPHP